MVSLCSCICIGVFILEKIYIIKILWTNILLKLLLLGNLSEATLCYDRAIQLTPNDLSHRHGLLRCYLSLGEFNSVLDLVNGTVHEKLDRYQNTMINLFRINTIILIVFCFSAGWSSSLKMYKVEALWKLGQWDSLHSLIHKVSKISR